MIYELWKSGQLEPFIKLGIIRSSVPYYCEIYDEYIKLRDSGYGYLRATEITAEKLNVTIGTVKRAVAEVM